MTVSRTTRSAGPFVGNGVTTSFPFAFKVFTVDDIEVTFTDAAGVAGVITTGYTVALNADQDANPGGTINYPASGAPMAAPATLAIVGDAAYEQRTDLTNAGRFLPQAIENALDLVTILTQQLFDKVRRALVFPAGDTATGTLPSATARAGKYLAFDANGAPAVASGTGADAGLRTDLAASSGSSLVAIIQAGIGAIKRAVQDKLRETVSVMDFGVVGDGVTDDSASIQKAIDTIASYGAVQNAFANQACVTLKFPPGRTYLISQQLSATFRNYLTIDFVGATLKWGGANDGRMFDCMGCNYLRVIGSLVDGNSALGTFMRVSGGNAAGLGGKNNATGARLRDFVIKSMYAAGVKPWISTINDVPNYGDYSLDDSTVDNVYFSSSGYAAAELGSSEIRFSGCLFVSVTRGLLHRSGSLARLSKCVFSQVRWCHYVVPNAAVGEICNTDCYAEGINQAGPVEGAFLYAEPGGASTAVKSFSMRGGTYSQGAPGNVTTTSDFLSCADATASVFVDAVRWQSSKIGRINMGTKARALIRKSTLSNAFADYMPEIVGAFLYERIGRTGAFQISAPSVDSVTMVVAAGGVDDYAALTFTTIDKAMALIDQLGATQAVIDVQSNSTLSTRRYLAGDLRIISSNGSTLTFDEEIRIRAGGSLTIDTVTAVCGAAARCVLNRGGRFFANTLTISNGVGKYLVRHEHGLTVCNTFTLAAGRLVDASYTAGVGTVQISGANTFVSAEMAVVKGDSPIDIKIAGDAAPVDGTWDVGIKTVDPSPAAGAFLGYICTISGTPGTWKTYGSVAA